MSTISTAATTTQGTCTNTRRLSLSDDKGLEEFGDDVRKNHRNVEALDIVKTAINLLNEGLKGKRAFALYIEDDQEFIRREQFRAKVKSSGGYTYAAKYSKIENELEEGEVSDEEDVKPSYTPDHSPPGSPVHVPFSPQYSASSPCYIPSSPSYVPRLSKRARCYSPFDSDRD